MERLAVEPLTEQELNEAKISLKDSIWLAAENPDSRMTRLARNEYNFGRVVPLKEVTDNIDQVNREDLSRLAGKMLDKDLLGATLLGPLDQDGLARELSW
jgi:predicted Zn-dependent peptidase